MFVIPQIGKVIQRAALWTQVITTVVVFLVLLAFAFISYQNAQQTLEFQRAQVISQRLATIQDAMQSRMDENGNMSRAGAALFDGSEAVTADEWNRFYAKLDIENRYEGITSVGYAPIVRQGEEAAFLQTLQEQNVTNPAISPAGQRDIYTPVMYIQAYRDVTGSYGFDAYATQERRIAMERARDSGKVALTDALQLAATNELGAVLYAPVYIRDMPLATVEERRAAIQGYVFTGVRIERLLVNALPEVDWNGLGMVISEVKSTNLPEEIYSTINNTNIPGLERVTSSSIDLYGKEWQVTLYANNSIVSETEAERPSTILAGGIAISFIASVAVYLLIQYRTRSFALAEEHKLQQAKDELLSLASHQLRTPATGVKQYVGMVIDGFGGDVPREQQALLEQAYKSNERQLQIINEFLYVAKLGSGSLTTSVHTFDLVPVVQDVINEMQGDIQERKHSLRVRALASAKISSDEHSIRMIVENLLSNAVKYTKPGGTIMVTIARDAGDFIVSVEDTGIGIAKKDMDMLFKQFSRIPNELSSEVNGSGIGLYLAQQLAERNGGVIEITSVESAGSTFTLRLPEKSVKKITKPKK